MNPQLFPRVYSAKLSDRIAEAQCISFRHQFAFKHFASLDQTLKGPEGLEIRTLDYRDFLCPLKCQTWTRHALAFLAGRMAALWQRA